MFQAVEPISAVPPLETLKKIFVDAFLRDFCFEGYYKKTKGALNIG